MWDILKILSGRKLVKIIGTGTFGKVYMSQMAGKTFAMKVLHKRKVIKLKQIDHIKNEKEILATIQHPFIVNLLECFHDEKNLYLVFVFVQGGEVFRLLRKEQVFPNDVALLPLLNMFEVGLENRTYIQDGIGHNSKNF